VTGTNIDEGMLAAADQFVTEEDLENVSLVKHDLFACKHEPGSFDLVHARYEICPLHDVYAPAALGPQRGLGPSSRQGASDD
jgi:hypothetical protein